LAFTNYLFYPAYLNKHFDLIKVPIVVRNLPPLTKIKEEHIKYSTFPSKTLEASIYLDSEELIGKYVKNDMTLIQGGFFYKQQLCDDLNLVDDYELKANEYAFSLDLDVNMGFIDQLKRYQYVDLFFQANDAMDESRLIIGKLMEHVEILNIIEEDNKKQMIILIKEEDIDVLIAANNLGMILPYISGQSYQDDHSRSKIYDVQATRQLIQTRLYNLRYQDLKEVGNDN